MQLFWICGRSPQKLPAKEVNFSNAAGLQHATLLKNAPSHIFFKDFDPTGIENSFFVQHAEHQWLLLERYTHSCQYEQVLFQSLHENIIPNIYIL